MPQTSDDSLFTRGGGKLPMGIKMTRIRNTDRVGETNRTLAWILNM